MKIGKKMGLTLSTLNVVFNVYFILLNAFNFNEFLQIVNQIEGIRTMIMDSNLD